MAGTKPNDLPCMDLGEIRLVTFDWKGGAGANSLDGVEYECSPSGGVTFEDSSADGLESTVFITAAQVGCYTVIASGTLTSGELIKLKARVTITDPTQTRGRRDYE